MQFLHFSGAISKLSISLGQLQIFFGNLLILHLQLLSKRCDHYCNRLI
jgi:hypothetical protein